MSSSLRFKTRSPQRPEDYGLYLTLHFFHHSPCACSAGESVLKWCGVRERWNKSKCCWYRGVTIHIKMRLFQRMVNVVLQNTYDLIPHPMKILKLLWGRKKNHMKCIPYMCSGPSDWFKTLNYAFLPTNQLTYSSGANVNTFITRGRELGRVHQVLSLLLSFLPFLYWHIRVHVYELDCHGKQLISVVQFKRWNLYDTDSPRTVKYFKMLFLLISMIGVYR